MADGEKDIWARISSIHQPRPPLTCITCRWKMKVKRSKSLSPEPSSSHDFKRTKIETEDKAEKTESFTTNILDFSDDVLLNILKYLWPKDLLALSLCCKRLDRICQDRTLWRIIDCRNSPIDMKDLGKYKKFLQASTTKLAVRGRLGPCPAFRRDFLRDVSNTCTNLKELVIEECNINAHTIKVGNFPTTLEKLSLNGCALHNYIPTDKSYLFKMDQQMPNLTCLILSHCAWLTPHSLMVLSKIPKLTELRLDSCQGLGECVAYTSLATRFGFKTLEILDLRFTALGDSEICCFSSTKTLTHIYLERPKTQRPIIELSCRLVRWIEVGAAPAYDDPRLIQRCMYATPRDDVCLVSDRTVCALGTMACHRRMILNPRRDFAFHPEDAIFQEDIRVCSNPNLKCLVVRNYTLVTNLSLRHLASNASSLEFLDVTGTSVTLEGVQTFKAARPNVKIVTSFNDE